jgi:hypothetical protein
VQPAPELYFLAGPGEMAERTRSFDWASTALGLPTNWPQPLKTAVSICLGSRHPIVIWWGREAYTQFYNDAYIPFLGAGKHPGALGQSGRECWSEIWPTMGPMIDSVYASGQATWSEDFLYILNRNLPREEGYFTFSYSPILDESGTIGGIFCACNETTGRVIGERRLRTLRDLGRREVEAKTAAGACELAARTLADNPGDIPFALIYLLDANASHAGLTAAVELESGGRAAPLRIDLKVRSDAPSSRPLQQVLETGSARLLEQVCTRFGPRCREASGRSRLTEP